MSAERGSLIYIAFFNATKATISGDLGGQLKNIFEKKKSWRRGVVAFCCIPTVLAFLTKSRRGESLVLATVRLAFSSFYAIYMYSATRPPFLFFKTN